MFKKLIAAAAAVSVLASAGAAAAQPWGYDNGYRHRDYNNDGRYRDHDRGGDYRDHHWRQGERLDGRYRGERIDYRAYRLNRPPYGYEYRRTDTGDIVLAAVATGLIASVILNNR